MKYIRMKDHIEPLYIDEFTEEGKEYYKDCRIADTIEELCDEFKVVKYGAYGKLSPHSLSDFKILKQHNNYPNAQIFGYIMWLDENNILQIKVVAKMNDKGELELL